MSNRKRKKKAAKIVIWLVAVAVIAVFAVRFATAPKLISDKEIIPEKNGITTYYSFSGSVEAKNKQTVFADKAMQIKEIKVEKGQLITTNDTLLRTTMNEKIKSKIDGEISNIHVEENAQLMPGAKLLDIVDYNDLQLKIQVDEYDLIAASEGKEAVITINALGKDIKGTITEVSKEGIYSNGVTFFIATISLEKDEQLKIGMSAEAKILDKSVSNALTLPMSAIQFDDNNKAYVLVKDEKTSKRVDIELGITDGIIVEIKSGITENDIVLVKKDTNLGFRPTGMRQDGSSDRRTGGSGQ